QENPYINQETSTNNQIIESIETSLEVCSPETVIETDLNNSTASGSAEETEAESASFTSSTNSSTQMEVESQNDLVVTNTTNTTDNNTPFITVVFRKQKVKGKKKSYT
ncbi:14415_t:CDS:1, partial [Ambispora leptoticha]